MEEGAEVSRLLHDRCLTAIDARNFLSEPAYRSDVVHHVDLVHEYFVAEIGGNMYVHVLTMGVLIAAEAASSIRSALHGDWSSSIAAATSVFSAWSSGSGIVPNNFISMKAAPVT